MRSSNEKRWFIGIDGGGTKTKAAICDAAGLVKAIAVGEASNPLSRPWPEVERTIRQLVSDVIVQAGANETEVASLYIGIAGADRPQVKDLIHSAFVDQWKQRLHIDNDAVAALYSGTWGKPGIVLIAGTGSIAYAVTREGERHRVGGWGYLVGDEGSGYDLGRKAVAAVLRAYDGRGEATVLTDFCLDHYRVNRPDELIARIYGGTNTRKELAQLSELMEKAAALGDAVAIQLVAQAAESLVELAFSCQRKTGEALPVVLAGGLLTAETMLRREVLQRAGFVTTIPSVTPVVGSLVAAIARAGWSLDDEVTGQLQKSGIVFEKG